MSVLSHEQLNINFSKLKTKINDIDYKIYNINKENYLKNNKYLRFKDFSIEEIENYYMRDIINPIDEEIKQLYNNYNYYKTFPDDIFYNKIEINILLCNLLYKFCFFIYANNTYIKNIIEFKQQDEIKDFNNFIIEKIKATIKPPNYQEINSVLLNDLYYSYLLYSFNSDILDVRNTYQNIQVIDYTTIKKSELSDNSYTKDNISFQEINIKKLDDYENEDKPYDYFIIVDYIKFVILIIKDLYKAPNQHYITLPQYGEICWFISMITAISYSDGSKNLLIEKDFQTKVDNDFSKYIYYIIDNITRKHKIYNKDNYSTDCDLFKILKTEPIILLKKLILNLFKSTSHEIILGYLSNIVMRYAANSNSIRKILINIKNHSYSGINYGLDSVIYTVVIDLLSDEKEIKMLSSSSINSKKQKTSQTSHNITSSNMGSIGLKLIEYIYNTKLIPILNNHNDDNVFMKTNLNNLGLLNNYYNIISHFYNLLGISNKFFYKYENEDGIVIIDKNREVSISDPDIIIIHKFKQDDKGEYKNLIGNDFEETIDDDINNIIYKDKKYKLDYIIHGSNDKYTCINCGHVICGIHYENEEYYYDSRYKVDKIKCDSEKVNLPCPLLKSTWSDKITNDDYCYKLEKCGHIEWNEKNFNPIEKDNSTSNICYSKSNDIMLVYIKVKEITGGKNEKISVIHNSIKYNRKIYLQGNEKYIIFKKKYILLSKLKYNKKLNLYYI
jgi:hypothetical protein